VNKDNIYKDIFDYLNNLQIDTIEFIGSGRTKKRTEWIKESHSHDYMEIIYLLGGKANINVPGKVLSLSAFDMIVYPPGVQHQEFSDMHSPQEIISLALKVRSTKSSSTSFKLVDYDGVFRWLFEQIHREFCSKKGYYAEIMENHFKAMHLHMLRYFERSKIEEQDILSLSLQYIHDNYSNHTDMKKLASICHISESYLSRLFVKKIGMSPIRYLNLFRIKIAKKILSTEVKSIREVALQVGFEDSLYFSRAFKKNVKVTPSAYRKNEKNDVV